MRQSSIIQIWSITTADSNYLRIYLPKRRKKVNISLEDAFFFVCWSCCCCCCVCFLNQVYLRLQCKFHYTIYTQGNIRYAMVTPLRKAASYEPRIAILGIWGDTWLTRGKYGIYVAVRGSYGALTGSTWRLLPHQPYLLPWLVRGGNEDTLVSAA